MLHANYVPDQRNFCQTSVEISTENLSRIFPRVEIPGSSSVYHSIESVPINLINSPANYDVINLNHSHYVLIDFL